MKTHLQVMEKINGQKIYLPKAKCGRWYLKNMTVQKDEVTCMNCPGITKRDVFETMPPKITEER